MSDDSEKKEAPLISGIKIRRRVDPAKSGLSSVYRVSRSFAYSVRGRRTHFRISQGNRVLYSAKIKGKGQSEPIPIAAGGEVHYSSEKNAAYLLVNGSSYSIRALTNMGTEIATIDHIKGESRISPKRIRMNLFAKDSLIPHKLANVMPRADADGIWVLNFHGKDAIPSTKNVIMASEDGKTEFLMVRKVEKNVIEADCAPVMSPLAAFGFVITMFMAK